MTVRVAFFLPHFDIGGLERVVLNLLTHLNRDIFQPSLVLSTNRGELLPLLPNDIEVFSFDGIPMRYSIFRIRNYIISNRIDVIYCGTNAANLMLLLACRRLSSKPVLIVSEHTPPSLFLKNAKWRLLRTLGMKILYPLSDCLVAPTEQVMGELLEILGGSDINTAVLPNPLIDSSLQESDADVSNDFINGSLRLVSAGRLVRIKGFDILLVAFRALLDRGVNAELIILGEGPERVNLERQIVDLDISRRVKLPGNVIDPLDYFKKSSIFVLSSRQEGFGNVLVEAMSCGVPVISVDCPVGPRDVLQNGLSGVLVPPNDSAALASAIDDLASDLDRMNGLRRAGIKRAADFSIGSSVRLFESTVLSLSKRRPQRSP